MVGMGKLTTHVLDTASGVPAAGVDIRLYSVTDGRELKAAAVTNEDGRSEQPLLADELFETGSYELEFDVGAYFDRLIPMRDASGRVHFIGGPGFVELVVDAAAGCSY